ncbi:hypothetical protein D3C77_429040 [compost metagenome]
MRDLDTRAVDRLARGPLERQLQQADHRVHRRANFMTHCGQKMRLGATGLDRLLFGFFELLHRMALFGNVQPATNNPSGNPLGVLEWLNPMLDPHFLAIQFKAVKRLDRLALAHGLLVALVKVGQRLGVHSRKLKRGLAQHLLGSQADTGQVAAVAGQHAPIDIAYIQRWRHAIGQGFDEL